MEAWGNGDFGVSSRVVNTVIRSIHTQQEHGKVRSVTFERVWIGLDCLTREVQRV